MRVRHAPAAARAAFLALAAQAGQAVAEDKVVEVVLDHSTTVRWFGVDAPGNASPVRTARLEIG